MFKLVVTLRNGAHKILRMSREVVAHIVSLYGKMRKEIIFLDQKIYSVEIGGELLVLNDCSRLRFLDERTGNEFLTLE